MDVSRPKDVTPVEAASLRIALVVNSLARGGAEMQVVDLATTFAARGHRVELITLLPAADGVLLERLRDAGVSYASLGMAEKADIARASWRYRRLLQRFRPDVVHAHLFAAIMLARLGRLFSPRHRLIETSHTPYEYRPIHYRFYRVTAPLAGVWTSVCQEGIDAHVKAGAIRGGRLVRNGVRATPRGRDGAGARKTRERVRGELGLGGDFLWLAVGSMRDEQKDFGNLLAAFALVRETHPGARLAIAGSGKLEAEKRALAAERGLDDVVSFLGLRTDIADLLVAADGFVLSSAWEALPIVLLEAAGAALPIVTTDVGDVSSIVTDDQHGVRVPPRDAPALAQALRRVMGLAPEARAAMGDRARLRVISEFDLDTVASRWEQAYRAASNGQKNIRPPKS